jgi:hypothetical protein
MFKNMCSSSGDLESLQEVAKKVATTPEIGRKDLLQIPLAFNYTGNLFEV